MSSLTGSPFDPFFYLHHCNIDRVWAMWKMDSHAAVYLTSGGNSQHNRNDIMFPWVGTTAGYGSNLLFGSIGMPDFSALGIKCNVDALDHRALGYSYDTLAVIGIGLDRIGSMNGFTQVFHDENAGTIDKFYSNARAHVIGFTAVFDPVIELSAGEHTHMEFSATSADESFFLTAQRMDFEDPNWSYQLISPDGHAHYSAR